jgi:hypothetical protein
VEHQLRPTTEVSFRDWLASLRGQSSARRRADPCRRGSARWEATAVAAKCRSDAVYPLYCMLLYTSEPGLDADLYEYVVKHWSEVDAATGVDVLVFVVEDGAPDKALRRPLDRRDVYRIAELLDVRITALPAAVFFCHPSATRTLTVRLRDFLPSADGEGVKRGVRAIGEVGRSCAEIDDDDERLDAVREQSIVAHSRLAPPGDDTTTDIALTRGANLATVLGFIRALLAGA